MHRLSLVKTSHESIKYYISLFDVTWVNYSAIQALNPHNSSSTPLLVSKPKTSATDISCNSGDL